MATKKIETLVPRVRKEAPSCPESLAVDELRNTLIEFCISTDIYLQDLTMLQINKNVNEYSHLDLEIPVGAELNHIIDIFKEFSDSSATQISQKRYTRIQPKAQIGGVSIFDFYGKGRFIFFKTYCNSFKHSNYNCK
jgi:hypothetical protein